MATQELDFLSPELDSLNLPAFMHQALLQAELAGQQGELPIGAVLVVDGNIIARGQASHRQQRSQIRHAEINALLNGGERLWCDYRQTVLFTTVEPCPMCLGATVMADIPHIVFALHDRVVHSAVTVQANPYVHRHIRSYYGGVLADESAALFARFDPQALAYIVNGK